MSKDNLDWTEIDIDTLPGDLRKLHDSWHTKAQAAGEARKALEAALTAALAGAGIVPDGYAPIFSYRWGKVSMALKDASAVKSTSNGKAKLRIPGKALKVAPHRAVA